MANHKSALKRARQSEIRKVRNSGYKSNAKKAVKAMEARKDEDVEEWATRLAKDSVAAGEVEYTGLVYCQRCGKQVPIGEEHECVCDRCCGKGEKPLPCPICGKVTGE